MTLKTITRLKGFGAFGPPAYGTPSVWQFMKSTLTRDVLDYFKEYWRPTPKISTLYKVLLDFDVEPAVMPEDPILERALSWTYNLFKPKQPFRFRSLSSISRTDLPQTTNPGYPYSAMGYKTKAEAWDRAMSDAWTMWDKLCRGKDIEFFPAMVFAKGAVCSRDKIKTRFINGESLSTILLECMMGIPIEQHQFSGVTPAAYDYTPFRGGYHKFHEDLACCLNGKFDDFTVFSADFKSYDKTGCNEITEDIYNTYLSWFDLTTWSDGRSTTVRERRGLRALASKLCHHHIYTKMLMPDGYVFQKDVGDNSGSKMFQKIQNIRTCALITYVWLKQTGIPPDFIKVLGDDSCSAGFRRQIRLTDAVADLKNLGYIIHPEKSLCTSDLRRVGFLGRNLVGKQVGRDSAELLLRVLYPARPDKSEFDLAQRIVAMYYENGNGNLHVSEMLKRMWDFCLSKDAKQYLERGGLVDWSAHLIKLFKIIGLKKPPPCIIPSDERLISLLYIGASEGWPSILSENDNRLELSWNRYVFRKVMRLLPSSFVPLKNE